MKEAYLHHRHRRRWRPRRRRRRCGRRRSGGGGGGGGEEEEATLGQLSTSLLRCFLVWSGEEGGRRKGYLVWFGEPQVGLSKKIIGI